MIGSVREIPDPFLEIWDQAVIAMDRTYGDWNKHPNQTVESNEFTIDYLASIDSESPRRLDTAVLAQADANHDRSVTRDESQRFLEIQLGIRWVTDDLLRHADGRVFDFAKFIAIDQDGDSALSADELAVDSSGLSIDQQTQLDADGDGSLSISELSKPGSPYLVSPMDRFAAADRNADGKLDKSEMNDANESNTPEWIAANLAAFDDDNDRQLSLTEYRVSMLGNSNYPWHKLPIDTNRDRRLSFAEFEFSPRKLFHLQRRFYFHRLDLDRDGSLAPDEFPFDTIENHVLLRLSPVGEPAAKVFASDDYPMCAWADLSPDQSELLLTVGPINDPSRTRIRWMTIDGREGRNLCGGAMPSWSPKGDRFACHRYDRQAGVWIMRIDGTADRRIDDGWGAHWSMDGKWIAYTKQSNLMIHEVDSGQSKALLAAGTHPYRFLEANLAWSPDSNRIAFQGRLDDDHSELAIVDLTDGSLTRRLTMPTSSTNDIAWSAAEDSILFLMRSDHPSRHLIFELEPDAESDQERYPLADPSIEWTSIAISRDGKQVFATTTNRAGGQAN